MENPQENPQSEQSTAFKSRYISPETLISKMKIAFSNAKEPEILSELNTVGITAQYLDNLLVEVENIETLNQKQQKEYGEQYAETEKLNNKRAQIDKTYTRHRNLCKIHFKKDKFAYTTLGLDDGRKQAYATWLQQIKNFYAQLLANPTLKTKAETVSINEAQITAQQQALQALADLKVSQKKETGEAQKATETRDEAIDDLYPKYTDLLDYAKELFQDDQTLEKLGIIVKR